MPVSSFLSDMASRAQSAINASPLAQHLPGGQASTASGESKPGLGSSSKNHTLEALHHQLRQFGQQYGSASPVQKIITTGKGIAIDFDSVSRDAKAHSKELYMWGQEEKPDVKDVTDRLAFMNYVQGSLSGTLATKLDTSRASFKALRDAEANLAPKRNIRAGLQTQIARIEHGGEKGYEKKVAELRAQLSKLETEDEPLEKEVQILKRKAVRDSETAKWTALREYGEKLSLVAQASLAVVEALPTLPPTAEQPYQGAQITAAARASLQSALDKYQTGQVSLAPHLSSVGADLSRSDTRSFGESHREEIDSIHTTDARSAVEPGIPITPPAHDAAATFPTPPAHPATHPTPITTQVTPGLKSASTSTGSLPMSPLLDPSTLNHEPAPIPSSPPVSISTSLSPAGPIDPMKPETKVPSITPTVAETGMPVSASSHGGPGPATGSLKQLREEHAMSPTATSSPTMHAYGSPGAFASAEDEKKRLQREERERLLAGSGPSATQPQYESAEDEKKRLEREERERILAAGGSGPAQSNHPPDDDNEELPPYQEPSL
ncbi:hypothetical protein PUNSTDRAFT_94932 [Punctularia strigosozonata HHB-11173 SS5]|uniref:uncharacterized protein n=1 Tax=Punctularia strigosozonata (strain HHB-11173) TaxID=741275 RepID=UPI0004416340|nr:uncharacterized protein PUNSTDRAFT_94932 [Punctularia strigosozonata HHB-11173 SS5]EIN13686.1 hypothetical protein PUNSTDRAFT_94932 [Punctularia strigosozonata HHB-11173 SS5]